MTGTTRTDAIAEELEERLNGEPTPDEPVEEPDLEDEPEGDPDQPEEDADELGGDEPLRTQPEQPQRRTARDRVQEALRERDAQRERSAALERELQAERQRNQQRAQQEDQQREEQILAGLDEQGRTQYLMAKALKRTEDGQVEIRRELADSRDAASFAAKAAKDPRRARLMDEVEATYQRMRPQAPDIKRDAVYLFLLGQKLDSGALDAGTKQRTAASRRVAAQRAPAGRARSDAQPRARRGSDLASRMEADDPAI